MKRVYTLLVQNKPGCLDRIAGFTRRYGWNITGMVAAETPNKDVTRITIAIECDKFCELPDEGISKLSFVLDMRICDESGYSFHEVLVARGPAEVLESYAASAAKVERRENLVTVWWLGGDEAIAALETQLCALPGVKAVRSGPMALAL